MIALLYHDIVPEGAFASSGFVSPDANIYKFSTTEFERHLEAIAARKVKPLLTFDDGGISAIEHTAQLIERFGHKGRFFITTDYIGKPGFLSAAGIVELANRGHLIGSHSCSHPELMARCSVKELDREWRQSIATLSDILGFSVASASVPGGSYSRAVGSAAAHAGVRELFTSEPTTSLSELHHCKLIGRFSVQQGTSAETAAALAAGDFLPRFKLAAYWNFKKVLKKAGGNAWIKFRKSVLARNQNNDR
jgi:peptidoglycan/xylan/chitin deacetylase (PgdA/CDA1 family)